MSSSQPLSQHDTRLFLPLFTPAMTRNIGSIRPLRHTLHTNIRLTRRHHTMEPYLHKNRILQLFTRKQSEVSMGALRRKDLRKQQAQ